MARSKYDLSNTAIRIFLQNVGKFYDSQGFEPFVPKVAQVDDLLTFFGYECCYCDTAISRKTISLDHLIPMNKVALGLHAWGNVVPCCKLCNNEKQQKAWKDFIEIKSVPDQVEIRRIKIEEFIKIKQYDPNLNLHDYAGNLYEDVGAVTMALIDLRYKQAEAGIKQLLEPKINL